VAPAPALILLNGPPGCGKSTLARMYADEHPLALALDVDVVRGMLGRWREDAHPAGLRARAIALAAARTHLGAGCDVLIPQFLGRVTFIEQCEEMAGQAGARFHEVALLDSRENSLRRYLQRGPVDGRLASADELAEMYDRLLAVIARRPATKVVRTRAGQAEAAYRAVLTAIEHGLSPVRGS
jgi:predicted kinase